MRKLFLLLMLFISLALTQMIHASSGDRDERGCVISLGEVYDAGLRVCVNPREVRSEVWRVSDKTTSCLGSGASMQDCLIVQFPGGSVGYFHGVIDGFTHTPGYRSILRVKITRESRPYSLLRVLGQSRVGE